MKLRTQFTFAFFFFAVLPLAVIVLYSYWSSQRALRKVVETEAGAMTEEMEDRMAAVRLDLARRVHRVGELGLRQLAPEGHEEQDRQRQEVMGQILEELGEAAPLVQSFEFTSRPGSAPLAPASPAAERPAVPVAPAEPSGFVIRVDKIVQEVEEKIAAELEGRELDAETLETLRRARQGVAAAASIVDGIGRIADVLRSGEELSAGDPEVRIGEEPELGEVTVSSAAAPAPNAAWAQGLAHWSARWQEQQQEWQARFREWEEGSAERTSRGAEEAEAAAEAWAEGGAFYVPVREDGEVVGAVKARISSDQVLRGVLTRTRQAQGEVPFAVDGEGNLFTLSEPDRDLLSDLPLTPEARARSRGRQGDWVVATSEDPATGLSYGIARPIGESLAEIRIVAARNFALGLALLLLAVVAMRPLSRRMTGSLRRLNEGVERLAEGDLGARVDVRSRNEIGQLARAFNRMADQIQEHQARLLEEEKRRREEEVERKLFEAEFARKSEELEEARRFQLSLLPKRLPEHPRFDLAVKMETATEVGGDYYDFRLAQDGALTCAVGDATGHGARAGTMVTVIKSLFSALEPEERLSTFLTEAGSAVRRMNLGRMAMALTLAQLRGDRLRLSAAGMPPALLHRHASGEIEELLVEGMPLGGLATDYRELEVRVNAGDTLVLMTDGLPELPDTAGEPFGYGRVRRAFADCAGGSPNEIVASLERQARKWAGSGPPNDDMTFVVLRVR